MKLHHLTFRGLGPFREEQEIDFADLSAAGLFLLEGPTGSGKSTVIDAIVFALYGKPAAEAADDARLVSHYLTQGAEPFVELVFETGTGIYRVRRTPAFERPKQRGTGTTMQNASAKLWRLTSPEADGEMISTKIEETASEIQRAIGLNRDQFIGTVVLPQGEFARFLRAGVDERRSILQRIFRTERYQRLEGALKGARDAARKQHAEADQAVRAAAAKLVGAAGLADELPEEDLEAAASDVVAEAERRAAELAEQEQTANRELEVAREVHDERAGQIALRDRRRKADSDQVALDADQGGIDAVGARIEAAERSARVADQIAARQGAATRLKSAEGQVAQARELAPVGARESDTPELGGMRQSTDAEVGRLRDLVAVEQSLAERGAAIERLEADRQQAQSGVADAESELGAIPPARTQLARQRDAAQQVASRAEAVHAQLDDLGQRRSKAGELAIAVDAHADASSAVQRAAQAAAKVAERRNDVQARYFVGIAAELAGQLQDGAPCMVCGATEHPAPAQAGDEHVTRDAFDAAELAWRAADDKLRKRQHEQQRAEVRVAGLAAEVGDHTVAELDELLAVARAEQGAIERAKAEAEGIEQRLATLSSQEQELFERRSVLLQLIASLDSQLAADQQRLGEDHAKVELQRAGHPSVAARVEALAADSRRIGELLEALGTQHSAAAEYDRAERDLSVALAREAFPTIESAQAAAVPATELAQQRERVAEHQKRRLLNSQALAELANVDPGQDIDLAGAQRRLDAARQRHEDAAKAHGVARDRAEQSAQAAGKVRTALAKRDTLQVQTAPLMRVARLALGDNRLDMTLATYVLQQRFESVVAAANDHLRVMSDGQLALVAHDEAEGSRRKGGLGLRVVDQRTDSQRPVGTVSGGELFYTSLSLALGLAGVVTAEAGGVSLETLFVDEGFGSLSSEVLDDVMTVLDGLRAGGRTVGVVSHVDEMKNRIPERVEVRRDGRGPSRVKVVA